MSDIIAEMKRRGEVTRYGDFYLFKVYEAFRKFKELATAFKCHWSLMSSAGGWFVGDMKHDSELYKAMSLGFNA